MSTKTCISDRATFRPLDKGEIDRRIDTLVQELAFSSADVVADQGGGSWPKWISAAELIERMRPFIVLN